MSLSFSRRSSSARSSYSRPRQRLSRRPASTAIGPRLAFKRFGACSPEPGARAPGVQGSRSRAIPLGHFGLSRCWRTVRRAGAPAMSASAIASGLASQTDLGCCAVSATARAALCGSSITIAFHQRSESCLLHSRILDGDVLEVVAAGSPPAWLQVRGSLLRASLLLA